MRIGDIQQSAAAQRFLSVNNKHSLDNELFYALSFVRKVSSPKSVLSPFT